MSFQIQHRHTQQNAIPYKWIYGTTASILKMSIFYISSGTKNFLIHGSYDKSGDWVLLANGTLEDPRTAYEDCTVPPVKVSVGKQDYPFVRFTAVDFYGLAAALMYFSVEA